jgi:hypothetical protein
MKAGSFKVLIGRQNIGEARSGRAGVGASWWPGPRRGCCKIYDDRTHMSVLEPDSPLVADLEQWTKGRFAMHQHPATAPDTGAGILTAWVRGQSARDQCA